MPKVRHYSHNSRNFTYAAGGPGFSDGVYAYFQNLPDHIGDQPGRAVEVDNSEFREKWGNIPNAGFSADRLHKTIHATARDLGRLDNWQATRIVQRHFNCWAHPMLRHIRELDPKASAQIMHACDSLRTHPGQEFMRVLDLRDIETMPGANEQDLMLGLVSRAALVHGPSEDYLRAWQAQADKIFTPDDRKGLGNSLLASAIIDSIYPNEITPDIAKMLYERRGGQPAQTKQGQTQIAQACFWFDDLPDPGYFIDESGRDSGLELDCKKAFGKADFNIYDKSYLNLGGVNHRVDFGTDFRGTRFYCEVDGEKHFIYALDRHGQFTRWGYDGSTLFQTALEVKAMGSDEKILRLHDVALMAIFEAVASIENPDRRCKARKDILTMIARNALRGEHKTFEVVLNPEAAAKAALRNRISVRPIEPRDAVAA